MPSSKSRRSADNRHEAPAAKETQIAGQGDVAVAIVGDAGDDAGQQIRPECSSLVSESGWRMQQSFGRAHRHHVADHGGEPRGAVVFARQPHPDAHGKQQPEIDKYGLAGRGHRRPS